MIVTANSLASVNFVTGTWQIEMGYMVVSFFVFIFYSGVPVQGNSELSQKFTNLGYYGLFYHTLAFCVKIGCAIQKNSNSYLRSIVMLMLMFLQVGLLLTATEAAYMFVIDTSVKNTYNICMFNWCFMQLFNFVSVIVSYVFFMMFRACTRQKLDPALEVPEHKRLPVVDSLVGMQFLANMFVNQAFPVFMSLLDQMVSQTEAPGDEWVKLMHDSIFYIGVANFVCTYMMIFVSWRSGPEFWKSCSPFLYFCMMFYIYIVVPSFYIPVTVIFMMDPHLNLIEDNYTTWILVYTIMQLGNLIDWLIDGRARFLLQRDIYVKLSAISKMQNKLNSTPEDDPNRQKILEELEALQVEKFEDDKKELVPYKLKPRGLGEGFVRIDTKMELSKEIYTLCFLSNLEIDYIEQFVDVMTAQKKNDDGEVDKNILSQKQQLMLFLLDADPAELDPLQQNQQKLLLLQKKDIVISKRAMIFQNTQLCFCCQILLCTLILWQILVLDSDVLDMFESVLVVILCRFIAAINLHLALMDELIRSISYMKFAINHPYMFRSWGLAYLAAFQQAFILCFVELICVAVVCISVAPISIVFNFIALAIIADFDMYIYNSYSDCMKKMIDLENEQRPVLRILHTSSAQCKIHEKADSFDDDGNKRQMRIRFMDRSWQNKVAYVFYKFIRGFFVSFYFYFTPYATLILSLGFPIYYFYTHENEVA